jgi:hypothetical protein
VLQVPFEHSIEELICDPVSDEVVVAPFCVADRLALHEPLVPALEVIDSDWFESGLPCWFVVCETVQVSLGFVPWKLQQCIGPICVCCTPAGAESVWLSVCLVV